MLFVKWNVGEVPIAGSWEPGAKGPYSKLILYWRIALHQDKGREDGA